MNTGEQILVIDDQVNTLNFLASLFKQKGYSVKRAITSQLGWAAAMAQPPDLILLDIIMPGADGYEMCRRFKQHPTTQDIPIIFISFVDDVGHKVKAFQVGAVDYITKPFHQEEVLARVENQLTIRRLRHKLEQKNQQLQASEIQYRMLVECSYDVIWTMDTGGRFTFLNPAAERVYGYRVSEMIGRSCLDFVDPEFLPHCQGMLAELMAGRPLSQYPTRHQNRDRRGIDLLVNAEPIYNESGLLAGFTGTFTDISALRLAQQGTELLLETIQAIVRSQELTQAFQIILRLISQTINWEVGEAWLVKAEGTEQLARYPQAHSAVLSGSDSQTILLWSEWQAFWLQVGDLTQPQFLEPAVQLGFRTVLSVPICWQQEVLAVLVFFTRAEVAITSSTLQLVGAVADQLGLLLRQKIDELNLRQNERQLQTLFAALQDVVILRDRQGICLKVIPTNTTNLYLPPKEMVGKTLHETLPPAVADQILAAIHQALDNSEVVQIEYSLNIRDRLVWLEAGIFPLEADQVMIFARDVSDRHRAAQILEDNVRRERVLTSAIKKIRHSLDLNTIFQETVQELRQALGCDRVLIYQMNPDWSGNFVAESVGAGWVSLLSDTNWSGSNFDHCIIKTLSPVTDTYLQESQGGVYRLGVEYLAVSDIDTKDFDQCYLDLLASFQAKAYLTIPIWVGDRLWGLLASYHNQGPHPWQETEISIAQQISGQLSIAIQQAELLEQTRAQAIALQEAVQAAQAASQAKGKFLSHMSHELRTPLNVIIGFTQILAQGQTEPEQQKRFLESINRAGEHLLAVINNVLEISKIEAGQVTIESDSCDLWHLLTTVVEMFALRASHRGVQLICKPPQSLPRWICTDSQKLRQILINLVGNAVKFTEAGQILLKAEVSQQYGDRLVLEFQVQDTGPGISPAEASRLFNPFQQASAGRRSQEGTGLGLAISSHYVQLLGGRIWVESIPAQGCTFHFTIDTSLSEPPPTRAGAGCVVESRKILVIDKSDDSRLVLSTILRRAGFEVQVASNFSEYITEQPDLVCLDDQLLSLDDVSVIQRIKQQYPNAKILVVTANAFIEQQQQVLTMGCHGVITKPVQAQKLLQMIGQLLQTTYAECQNWRESQADVSKLNQLLAQLRQMKLAWRQRLEQLAIEGNDQLILQLLDQGCPAPLQETLAGWASEFQFDRILELAQQVEKSYESAS